MIIQYRTFSECGPRYKNEDSVGCVLMPEQQRAMFILCDGMGGHRSGDIASQTVVKTFTNFWRSNPNRHDCYKKIIDAANEAMIALEKQPQVEMGTTMVMASKEGRILRIAHCGDSRAYFYHRHNGKHWRTKDHRSITPEGWEYVTKGFIQGENTWNPDIQELYVSWGDKILICSDGLYDCFSDNELNQIIEDVADIDELYALLLKRGKERARDNYSAIIIYIVQV